MLLFKQLEIKIDRFILKIYRKTKLKPLAKYMSWKTNRYAKDIIKFAQELIKSDDISDKIIAFELLKQLQELL